MKQQSNDVTHKNLTPYLNCLLLAAAFAVGIIASSCNAKDKDDEEQVDTYYTTESVAITNFSLAPDLRVMKNLDSVYFSIDLEHGVVFNADSLPKGTDITKLIPKISYPSSVTSAVIEMKGGTHREGTVNYYSNANDTIDFTGDVTLTLGASDKAITKTYRLMVNVHKEDPDTIYWDRMSTGTLPSRLPSPKAQKSVAYGGSPLSLIEESDGSYTVARTADIFGGTWDKTEVNLDFRPDLETLSAVGSCLYLVGDGVLMSSPDGGLSWQKAASGWTGVIGRYGDMLLGMAGSRMTTWPEGQLPAMELPQGFPVSGFTAPVEFSNRWTTDPTIVIFGGVTASGEVSQASWAFDGSKWADISDRALPPLEGISAVEYYSYLKSASNGLLREFDACLVFGGRDADGNVNNTVYVSYDHGINWQRAQGYMQLPAAVEAGYMVDALAFGTSLESSLSDRWSSSRRRIPFEIDGDTVRWNCPYIFLFGGFDGSMTLNPKIRSGVLQRLTFVPLF